MQKDRCGRTKDSHHEHLESQSSQERAQVDIIKMLVVYPLQHFSLVIRRRHGIQESKEDSNNSTSVPLDKTQNGT